MAYEYTWYLEHHGIKGQKWGVRRYQNSDGSLTPAGRERYGVGGSRIKHIDGAAASRGKEYTQKEINAMVDQFYTKSGVNKKDEKYREVEVIKNSDGSVSYKTAAQRIAESSENPYPKKNPGFDKRDIKAVNPHYGSAGTTKNCVRCSIALELRKRGYDIRAGRAMDGAVTEQTVKKMFQGAKQETFSKDNLDSSLRAKGSDASGILTFSYSKNNSGSGHCIYWYNDKKTGKTIYADGQVGRTTKSASMLYLKYNIPKNNTIAAYQLNDKKINYKNMSNSTVIRPPKTSKTATLNTETNKIEKRYGKENALLYGAKVVDRIINMASPIPVYVPATERIVRSARS